MSTKCPKCQSSAYIGFNVIECVGKACLNYSAKLAKELGLDTVPVINYPKGQTFSVVGPASWQQFPSFKGPTTIPSIAGNHQLSTPHTPTPKFKVGDRIKYTGSGTPLFVGKEGVVTTAPYLGSFGGLLVGVRFDGDVNEYSVHVPNLSLIIVATGTAPVFTNIGVGPKFQVGQKVVYIGPFTLQGLVGTVLRSYPGQSHPWAYEVDFGGIVGKQSRGEHELQDITIPLAPSPPSIKVGSRVKFVDPKSTTQGTVGSINKGDATVIWDGIGPLSYPLDKLELIP